MPVGRVEVQFGWIEVGSGWVELQSGWGELWSVEWLVQDRTSPGRASLSLQQETSREQVGLHTVYD